MRDTKTHRENVSKELNDLIEHIERLSGAERTLREVQPLMFAPAHGAIDRTLPELRNVQFILLSMVGAKAYNFVRMQTKISVPAVLVTQEPPLPTSVNTLARSPEEWRRGVPVSLRQAIRLIDALMDAVMEESLPIGRAASFASYIKDALAPFGGHLFVCKVLPYAEDYARERGLDF